MIELKRNRGQPDRSLLEWVSRLVEVNGESHMVTSYTHSHGEELLLLEPCPEIFVDGRPVHGAAPGTFNDLVGRGEWTYRENP